MTPSEKPALVPIEQKSTLNGDFIYKISGVQYDQDKLYQEFLEITEKTGCDWRKIGQYNLHVRSEAIAEGKTDKELFLDFNGSLGGEKNKIRTVKESEFDTIHPILAGTYTETVLKDILGQHPGVGRIRWLMLQPKTCYSMHRDPDWYRLHIPIKTSEKSFFIVDEKYFNMPECGALYVIHPQPDHTAVNANLREERLHIVFDTAEEIHLYD